jgi:hypothetical protein
MTAASGTARTGITPEHGDAPEQLDTPGTAPAPVTRRLIIGLPAGRLKDASGAAPAAGLRPVLDPPARKPQTLGSYQRMADVSHACPATQPPPPKPPLTRLRSFRDVLGEPRMTGLLACQLAGDGSRRTVALWPARVPRRWHQGALEAC